MVSNERPHDVDRPGPGAASWFETPIVAAALLLPALAWAYGAVFAEMAAQWWSNTIYNYAFLIPFISAYMVWTERAHVRRAVGAPSYWTGVPMILAGLAMLVAGRAGSVLVLQEFSILPTAGGLVLLAGGVSLLRAVGFPLLYLLFMVPFWDLLIAPLHHPLQISSAVIGEWILGAAQIPVHRSGTLLALPKVTLEVAEQCSGVNFLIAIAAVALPYVYLSVATHWRRVVVVTFALVVAMVSNGLRVALIGISQQWAWWTDLHGPGHLLHGMVVAVVGYVALLFGAHLLGGRVPAAADSAATPGAPSPSPGRTAARGLLLASAFVLLAASFKSTLVATTAALSADPSEVPLRFDDWVAVGSDVQRSALRASNADHELGRTYQSPTLGLAHLYVGYYATQAQGRELQPPVGAVGSRTAVRLDLPDGEPVHVVEARVAGSPGRVAIYWYDLNGRITTDVLRAKGLTIWNGLVHRRTTGAFVCITLDPPRVSMPRRSRPAPGRSPGSPCRRCAVT